HEVLTSLHELLTPLHELFCSLPEFLGMLPGLSIALGIEFSPPYE
ncbi:hypothetical protein GPDM_13826, partial [Planococcus donghaensis MPA1U2]